MGELMFTSGVWIGLSDFILTHLLITICHNPEDIGNALDEGKLPIMINLNFSKRRIMQELEILVSHWKVKHKHWAGGFSLRSDEHFSIKKAKKRLEKWLNDRKKYSPTYHYDNYDDYLRVWDLKDQGYSYAKIADKLDLNSRDTARNYYKTANKLIEQGIGWYDDSR
jgi:hypothetical protein